ncbi:uroporphyrinogen-III C-methyltransferase [Oceanobacillus piezotolerans]|uniref:Uroporphyrinogen-III C-methyltransferase n=1 Tax=Oceanobacillus piezotolerans TaxID=2448030 RepID=A0A498DH53_9BACI|nr:uroporphyrinogen-III C-methyltransferase [Oceanobacillus piezotolerans]RLL48508.1 uroporphyrinogen-III C-methyltransferase [Oceanobacillus piezotolerans]
MGKVYLVGAGPGDPELITVKGVKAIEQSDVILYDRLVNPELLNYAKDKAELIYCGKRPDQHTLTQETINALLCKFAHQGKVVTRLKGGDPFIFGRGGEEAEILKENGIPFEIVPGITSGSAAPAYAGIPLTHRDYSSSVSFVSGVSKTAESEEAYWKNLAQGSDTLCIYMGVKKLPDICERLIRHGRDSNTPVALIHWGTTDKQQTVTGTLANIVTRAHAFKNPSMIIIGEVVGLREKIQWFENASLEKTKIAQAVIG